MMEKVFVRTEGNLRCFLYIESIVITDPEDKKLFLEMEDENNHTGCREIAKKYTENKLFHEIVDRLIKLEEVDLTWEEREERQSLITLVQYFRISLG